MYDDDTAALLQFIRDELLPDPSTDISPTTPLISEGLLDSLSVVRLAAFIEERFAIRFDDVEIRAPGTETVRDILARVRKTR
jgi:acyl carrier protein